MALPWLKGGKLMVDGLGRPIICDDCSCDHAGSGHCFTALGRCGTTWGNPPKVLIYPSVSFTLCGALPSVANYGYIKTEGMIEDGDIPEHALGPFEVGEDGCYHTGPITLSLTDYHSPSNVPNALGSAGGCGALNLREAPASIDLTDVVLCCTSAAPDVFNFKVIPAAADAVTMTWSGTPTFTWVYWGDPWLGYYLSDSPPEWYDGTTAFYVPPALPRVEWDCYRHVDP